MAPLGTPVRNAALAEKPLRTCGEGAPPQFMTASAGSSMVPVTARFVPAARKRAINRLAMSALLPRLASRVICDPWMEP